MVVQNSGHQKEKINDSENFHKIKGNKSEIVCKYHNTGFCKYGDKCKFFHAKSGCDQRPCKLNTCKLRHPKLCKYKESCKRQADCFYVHKKTAAKNHDKKVMEENKELKSEVARINENLVEFAAKLEKLTESFKK